ncbi:hypothetical protein PIB30_035814 [Stylosanthes scabra]|uniref:DDT domain-containing protein DDR4 n=1 Tax=Stylosanthes scabra TaxID=79078 RepID=A0ABU6XDD0_9FABA|nr:hypothetical protein [Stylosanthes scabra]
MPNDEEHSGGEENTLDDEILKLRGCWELASVLNFFDVFSSILGKEFKLSAEELEIGIVKPDSALAQLHIQLLKGIPPVNKNLVNADKWVTALCKKLTMWWSWVAEGKIPLVPSNGEEISKYKELNPSDRLRLLKALCEVRAEQNDAVSYINDSLKQGTKLTSFRKDALGRDGTASFWYDANAKCQSHRLYREIITSDSSPKNNVNGCSSLPIKFQWETLATNLEEFSKAAETFSGSNSAAEVAIGKKLESDAIPVLEKLKKNKEKAAKRKQRQEMLSNDFRNYCSGNTRSCRTRRPVNYSFEAYDRTMKEAIQLTNKRKISSSTERDKNPESEDKCNSKDDSTDSDSKQDVVPVSDSDDTGNEVEDRGYSEEHDDDDDADSSELGNSEAHSSRAAPHTKEVHSSNPVSYPRGVRYSKRLAGVPSHTLAESRGLASKQRLRQRPTRNSALESIVIPDSDDEHENEDISESN